MSATFRLSPISEGRPLYLAIIAGPCGIETRDQAFKTAERVAQAGAQFFRGGAYKPRTSPYSFQGLGEEGLSWISNQMLEAFMSSRHVDEVFADDVIMRRKIKEICKKHMQIDEAIEESTESVESRRGERVAR